MTELSTAAVPPVKGAEAVSDCDVHRRGALRHSAGGVRSAQVHDVCLDCHGTGPYTNPERKIKSRDALRQEVVRWGDYYNPALSAQDVDDLVAYLDKDFYKF